MTQIDRYILVLFLRTVFVCFLSLAGIFIVFHAFTSMDELIAQAKDGESVPKVLAGFYGPYLLLLFDMTGAIITLMAFLFTVGWLQRTQELTATLSAGVSHGRILRPMVIASLGIILIQLFNREFVIPQFRDSLTMKAQDASGEIEQPVLPTYDQESGILIEGSKLRTKAREITKPNFRLYSDYGDFGDLLLAEKAVWWEARTVVTSTTDAQASQSVSGYLLQSVRRPETINELPSRGLDDRLVLFTSADQPWLQPGECFVTTTVHPNMLQTQESATRLASVQELSTRVRNPAVHSSLALRTFLHERIVRAPLDFGLVLLVLPLVVNRHGKKLFVLIGSAVGIVLAFFAIKTLAGAMGGGGMLVSPGIAAWLPLLIVGPIAYVRLRAVQAV